MSLKPIDISPRQDLEPEASRSQALPPASSIRSSASASAISGADRPQQNREAVTKDTINTPKSTLDTALDSAKELISFGASWAAKKIEAATDWAASFVPSGVKKFFADLTKSFQDSLDSSNETHKPSKSLNERFFEYSQAELKEKSKDEDGPFSQTNNQGLVRNLWEAKPETSNSSDVTVTEVVNMSSSLSPEAINRLINSKGRAAVMAGAAQPHQHSDKIALAQNSFGDRGSLTFELDKLDLPDRDDYSVNPDKDKVLA